MWESSFCTSEPALGVGYDTQYRSGLETWLKSISTGVQYISLDNKIKYLSLAGFFLAIKLYLELHIRGDY